MLLLRNQVVEPRDLIAKATHALAGVLSCRARLLHRQESGTVRSCIASIGNSQFRRRPRLFPGLTVPGPPR